MPTEPLDLPGDEPDLEYLRTARQRRKKPPSLLWASIGAAVLVAVGGVALFWPDRPNIAPNSVIEKSLWQGEYEEALRREKEREKDPRTLTEISADHAKGLREKRAAKP